MFFTNVPSFYALSLPRLLLLNLVQRYGFFCNRQIWCAVFGVFLAKSEKTVTVTLLPFSSVE